MIDHRLLIVSFGIAALAASVAGCGGGSQGDGLQGAIRLEGPRIVALLSRAVARDFERQNPGVDIAVARSDDEQAFNGLCAGDADIAGASRPIGPSDAEACKRNDVSYAEAAVANQAVVVLLNPKNPKTCIRIEQLAQIWRPKRPISSWSQLVNDVTVLAAPIERFGPDPSSAPFEFFTTTVNGVEGRQTRAYAKAGAHESRTVDRVAKAEGGIGYVNFPSFPPTDKAVRAAEVESKQTDFCVSPSLVSVQDGSYNPLGRELLIYPSARALEEPAVEAFVEYYVEHAGEVAASVGLVPLSEAQRENSEEGLGHEAA